MSLPELQLEFSRSVVSRRLTMNQSAQIFVSDGGILYMDSLGPCIGYVGFDPNRQILFGKHFPIHENVDRDLFVYQNQLEQIGISTQNTAVAGGHLNPAENFPNYYAACQQAKERILKSSRQSFMLPGDDSSSTVDYLAVKFVQETYLIDHYRFY